MDPRVRKMAEVLINYCVGVRPGDWVSIHSPVLGEPLANECVRASLGVGGNPTVQLRSDEAQETLLKEGNEEQLSFIAPSTRAIYEQADVTIVILAPENTRNLSQVDPSRMALQAKAQEPVTATFMSRHAKGELRWTGCQYPTQAAAQDAGMSLREYEDFVYGAGLLNEPDPVEAWKRLGERQDLLIDRLKGKQTIHLAGPGTDLTLSVADRTWSSDDGHLNFPGGEIYTCPVEDSVEGTVAFSYPAFLRGCEVTGVRLVFEKGRVVEATATGDEEYLQQMLNVDEGARRLGEFAIGTNPGIQHFSKNTLFDEKIGGTLHMALGKSIPEGGGTNDSALHWDMVYNLREGAEVTVDGELFSRNGEFVELK